MAARGTKVVGLNCHARIGQRVQLTTQGRKSLDERFHKISGGRAGTIVSVLGDGALATVRWDCAPAEEHQYRVGRFGRFELSIYEGPDVAPPPPLKIDNPKDHSTGRSELESLSDRSVDEHDSLQLSRSSMESESDTVASSAASFSADAYHEHLTKIATKPHPMLGEPTFTDTFGGAYIGPPSSSLRPSNKSGQPTRYKNPLHKSSLKPPQEQTPSGSQASMASSQSPTTTANDTAANHRDSNNVAHKNEKASQGQEQDTPTDTYTDTNSSRPFSVQFDPQALSTEEQKADKASLGKRSEEEAWGGDRTLRNMNPSLLSVVVKNPLRQGLQWAGGGGEEDGVRSYVRYADRGAQEGAGGLDGESPSLMSILVRRPLRGGLAIAEQLQHTAFFSSPSDQSNVHELSVRPGAQQTGGAGGSGVQRRHSAEGQGARDCESAPRVDAWNRSGEPAWGGIRLQREAGVDHVKDIHVTSRLPGRRPAKEEGQLCSAGRDAGGVADGRRREQGGDSGCAHGMGAVGGGNPWARISEERGETEEAEESAVRAELASASLITVVVKEPLRRTGWLDLPVGAEEGDGSATKREPSLLSVIVKQPLREFVWGSSDAGAGKQKDSAKAGADASVGADDDGEAKEEELDDDGVLQSGTHWGYGLTQTTAAAAAPPPPPAAATNGTQVPLPATVPRMYTLKKKPGSRAVLEERRPTDTMRPTDTSIPELGRTETPHVSAVDRLKKVLKEERLQDLKEERREDPDLSASVYRGCASKGGAAGEANAADTDDENDDLFYYRLEHGSNFGVDVDNRGDPSKAGDGGAEASASAAAEEEPVELDPDTMLPIVKGQNRLFVVGEEGEGDQEGEEELDPDTMMPVKKSKGPKRAAMRQFVSYGARKLTGWTAPTGARLICVDDDDNEEGDTNDTGDTASQASGRTNLSNFEIPRNQGHSMDLRRRTDRVMETKGWAYVSGGTKQRGGLDSFEGRIRARRTPNKEANKEHETKPKASKDGEAAPEGGGNGRDTTATMEEALEEQWDHAVEGVSRVFRAHRTIEW